MKNKTKHEEVPRFDLVAIFFAVVAGIVLTLVVCDIIFGAETVTNVLADLVVNVRN